MPLQQAWCGCWRGNANVCSWPLLFLKVTTPSVTSRRCPGTHSPRPTFYGVINHHLAPVSHSLRLCPRTWRKSLSRPTHLAWTLDTPSSIPPHPTAPLSSPPHPPPLHPHPLSGLVPETTRFGLEAREKKNSHVPSQRWWCVYNWISITALYMQIPCSTEELHFGLRHNTAAFHVNYRSDVDSCLFQGNFDSEFSSFANAIMFSRHPLPPFETSKTQDKDAALVPLQYPGQLQTADRKPRTLIHNQYYIGLMCSHLHQI